MVKRVLILSASSGMGHVRAAQALEHAFQQLDTSIVVRHEDSLTYTNPGFANLYSNTYLDLIKNAPEVLGLLYDYTNQAWKDENHRLAFERLNTGPLIKLVNDYQADIVLCTHFLPADIMSWLICRGKIKTQHGVVLTDFDVHAMWLCHHYSHYFVPLQETRVHMEKLGFKPERISVCGIPVDPVFAIKKDKRAMREKHGLAQDKLAILTSAGGFGVGPIEQILSALTGLKRPTELVAVCGQNRQLEARIEYLARTMPTQDAPSIKVIGCTTQMDELMAACDLILGKPGGLTAAEALVKGLVFLIVNPIPGQEERNADHLLEEGVALRCNNLPALAYKINKLLDDAPTLARMQERALALARPQAATDIARKVIALLEAPPPALAISPEGHYCEGAHPKSVSH